MAIHSSKTIMERRVIALLGELQLQNRDILKADNYAEQVASIIKQRIKYRGIMLTQAFPSICNLECENVIINEQIKHCLLVAECITDIERDYALKMIVELQHRLKQNNNKLETLYVDESQQWKVLSATRDNELKQMREQDKQLILMDKINETKLKNEMKNTLLFLLFSLFVVLPIFVLYLKGVM